jgi:ASC-1-like (ASCH) protein
LLTLWAKKEVLEWLKQGLKTIDVRKGKPRQGDRVLFVSGPHRLEMRIVDRQSGLLSELIRVDNFRLVIPSAGSVEEAWAYLGRFYGSYDGVFTAYLVEPVTAAESVDKSGVS